MTSIIRKTILAAVLGFGALAASVPAASAASLTIEVSPVGYRSGYYGPKHGHFVRDRGYRGRCAHWLAVDKARARGIRHARVMQVTPYKVVTCRTRAWRMPRARALSTASQCAQRPR